MRWPRDLDGMQWPPWADPALARVLVHNRVSAHVACVITREICSGLANALGSDAPDGAPLNWTHGSLCPRVVHLSTGGEVKVSGFGVGRLKPEPQGNVISEIVDERVLLMSPEQAAGVSGDPPEPQVDVFRVGAVLHAMITGRPLLEIATSLEYVRTLIGRERKTFSTAPRGISPELGDLSTGCSPETRMRVQRTLAPCCVAWMRFPRCTT